MTVFQLVNAMPSKEPLLRGPRLGACRMVGITGECTDATFDEVPHQRRGGRGEGVRGPNGGGNPDAGVGAITPSIDGALRTSTLHITTGLKDV